MKGNVTTATTNSNGIATFVIGNYLTNVKASSVSQVASVNYKVQLPADAVATEGTVNFAAVKNADITNVNNHNTDTTDNLVPSTNYTDTTRKGLATTASMDDPSDKSDEYVESQQVSSDGTSEHAVTMTGGYPVIYVPGTSSAQSDASKKTDEINYSSGKYNTYANDSYYYVVKEDPNKLTYATLNFEKVTLSAYTRMVVETFATEELAKKSTNPGVAGNGSIDQKIYDGEMSQSSIGYQIPLGTGYAGLCVKVTLQSAGQVDTAKNDGYTAKNVVYVYKTIQSTAGTYYPLKNATVEWNVVATPYTAESSVASVNGITTTTGEYLTQKLPVFPYTGTAVITKYDSNNKVVAYYAVATCNNGANQNIIDGGAIAYQISSDELRDKVGEITSQNGTSVTVDSKKSGRTTLEGTVKVDGKVVADAELASVYTSIQWNPIPKAAEVTASDAFVALLGQKIEVVAQLTDKNGNAVSESGHGISFKDDSNTFNASSVEITGAVGKATIVNTLSTTTDANGQAKMILKASSVAELLNIKAESSDSKYNAKLIIAGQTTDKADLYWIDANLSFTDKVQAGATTVATTTNNPAVVASACDIQPTSGTTWMYGVQTVGTKILNGKLKDKTITINGLDIAMSNKTGSVGTVNVLADVKGAVTATSTKAGTMTIVSKIDSATLTKDVTVSEGTFAGTGATSINKKLELPVTWKAAGVTASYVTPTGTRVTSAGAVAVYLKVTDSYGNGLSGKTVNFKVDDGNLSVTSATTDANGIATVDLTKGTGATSTVSATVVGISADTFEQTYTWVNNPTALAIDDSENAVDGGFLTTYDKEKKTVTLTFNDDVVESSVIKDLFTVTYASYAGTDTQLVVKSVAVSGNVVTLSLADVPTLVDARDTVKVAIATNKSVKSVKYTLTSTSGSSYGKTVTIKLDGINKPTEA